MATTSTYLYNKISNKYPLKKFSRKSLKWNHDDFPEAMELFQKDDDNFKEEFV